uniref:Uncharacterized protein n=1 Tax=Nucleocytoviricota sp. TaxID=2809609 RepID=A0A9E8JYW4_9VIRU|nr:hypothetical protein [Nucleocytoviricota sp.]
MGLTNIYNDISNISNFIDDLSINGVTINMLENSLNNYILGASFEDYRLDISLLNLDISNIGRLYNIYSYNTISSEDFYILNNKQIREYVSGEIKEINRRINNIIGDIDDSSPSESRIVYKNTDTSLNSLDICNILQLTNICNETTVLHVKHGKTLLQDLSVGLTDISDNLTVHGFTQLENLQALDVSFTNLDISNLLQLTNISNEITVLHVKQGKSVLQDLSVGLTDISDKLTVHGFTQLENLQALDVSFSNLDICNIAQLKNDLSYISISGDNFDYYLLNNKQIKQFVSGELETIRETINSIVAGDNGGGGTGEINLVYQRRDASLNNVEISNSLILDISNKQPNIFDIYSQPQSINVLSVENSQQSISINIEKFRQYKIPILNDNILYPIIDGIKLKVIDVSTHTILSPYSGYNLTLNDLQTKPGLTTNDYFKHVNKLVLRKSTDSLHGLVDASKNNSNIELIFNNNTIFGDISYQIEFYYYNNSELENENIRLVSEIKQLVGALKPQHIGTENIELVNPSNYTRGVNDGSYNITSSPSFDISWSFPDSYIDYSGNIDIIQFDISYSNNNSNPLFQNQQFIPHSNNIIFTPNPYPGNQNNYSTTLTNLKYGNVYDIQIKARNLLNENYQDFSSAFSSFSYYTNIPAGPPILQTSNDVNINYSNNSNFIYNLYYYNSISNFITNSQQSTLYEKNNILLNVSY